jgi:hypothetical protein
MSELKLPPPSKPREDYTDDEVASMITVFDALAKALGLEDDDRDRLTFREIVLEAVEQDVVLPESIWTALTDSIRPPH